MRSTKSPSSGANTAEIGEVLFPAKFIRNTYNSFSRLFNNKLLLAAWWRACTVTSLQLIHNFQWANIYFVACRVDDEDKTCNWKCFVMYGILNDSMLCVSSHSLFVFTHEHEATQFVHSNFCFTFALLWNRFFFQIENLYIAQRLRFKYNRAKWITLTSLNSNIILSLNDGKIFHNHALIVSFHSSDQHFCPLHICDAANERNFKCIDTKLELNFE